MRGQISMRFVKSIRSWCRKKIMAFIIAGLFVLLGLTFWLPPYEKYFVLECRLEVIAELVLGIAWIPLIIFLPFFNIIINIIWFAILGLCIGLATQFLWGHGRPGRIIIAVILGLNLFPGFFFFLLNNPHIKEPESCEKFISAANGLKIVGYPAPGFLGGTQLFFLATQDAGNHWRQVMQFCHDDPVDPDCKAIRSLDANNYWVWVGWQLAVTHDGGKTWLVWNPRETWKNWQCCNYGLIKEVSFESTQTGMMALAPIPNRGEVSSLYTNDGGKTWKENRE
jgi:hypothetical protein